MDGPLSCGLCYRASEGMEMAPYPRRNRRTFTFVLLACLAGSLICVAYPIYVIRPFRHQGARELALALAVIRFRPPITVLAALAAILALIASWRAQPLKWKRILSATTATLVIVLAFLA